MADVVIRDVDDALHGLLTASAARHRWSIEEEALTLLKHAVAQQHAVAQRDAAPREHIVDAARRLFSVDHGVDLALPPRGGAPASEPPNFEGFGGATQQAT